jgi:hypothetical protein
MSWTVWAVAIIGVPILLARSEKRARRVIRYGDRRW